MTSSYSEDILVEQPAIALFTELGWDTLNCFQEQFGISGTLGRVTSGEVVLVAQLRTALARLNPGLPTDLIDLAIEELARDRSIMVSEVANREIYRLLRDGVKVSFRQSDGEEHLETLRVIDWDDPRNNDFLLASQFWITGDMYKRRADLVGFVNGLPLLFIELKASHKKLENAYHHNLSDYKDTIPHIFLYNAFIILSNGSQSRIGSMTAAWEHFGEWKKITSEGETGIVSLETMIRGTCDKKRFLDIIENFIIYEDSYGGLRKLVARNHQFLGVNNAISRLIATLTPCPSPRGRGELRDGKSDPVEFIHYRGGLPFAGLVERARELRRQQTPAEQIFWEIVRGRGFMGLKFRRQHQIGNYIADFYCDEKKLVIELDGTIHDVEKVRKKDHQRDENLKSLGFTTLRISNDLILNSPEQALGILANASGITSSLYDAHSVKSPSPTGRGAGGEGKTPQTHTRLGVFWHTQGSGKSYSMVFFSQKVLRKLPGNWTFVVVTDRKELDDQIYKNFANCGAVTEPEEAVHADSVVHLKQLLQEDHRIVFTLIQKFRTDRGETYQHLSDRSDIIVMTDEAHRSQYDIFAMNMRNALPHAAFIGFTGTPLMAGEELTKQVFGDYVSVYDFKQSADDNATVPLYYENRIPELQLVNDELNEEMETLLETAELDEAQEKKLEREFAREYHLITRDERLEKVAEDVVNHFMGRGQMGKAMVIAIDKATAVRMYDKVQAWWRREIIHLQDELTVAQRGSPEADVLQRRLEYMQVTDMAVVVSQGQNEVEEFRNKGLDIATHRRRMNNEDLDKKFKDPADPLRIVFVCAMWITGFDVPCCSTIYLDKPMKNHTLMQTIARANRVFRDKVNGLIVDYIGVFRSLQKALAIYGAGSATGTSPVEDKSYLVAKLQEHIKETEAFCLQLGAPLNGIQEAVGFARVKLLDDAVEAILLSEATKRKFLSMAALISRLFKAILPDPQAGAFIQRHALFAVIAEKIRSLEPEPDISEVMGQMEDLLDRSIAAEAYVIAEQGPKWQRRVDLTKIDFDALRRHFQTAHQRTEFEKLKNLVEQNLHRLVSLNRTRLDFMDRFQKLIEAYNSGAHNTELIFDELVDFARKLNEEDRRHMAEELSEEELTILDLLTKPAPDLTESERKQVKAVALQLLEKLKGEILALDWRKRQQARAMVRLTIEETLDMLPNAYGKDLYERKCEVVYQHVYDSYYGGNQGVYARL